jgi:hypothetical protein
MRAMDERRRQAQFLAHAPGKRFRPPIGELV